jgi:predicted nucleic acid-binding protein
VSEEGGATTTPTPWVVDVSVLTAIARADPEVTYLVIALDGRGRPLIIPVLAITAASSDAGTEDGDVALRGLERLENVIVAPLKDAEQATRLAAVMAKTGLDTGDAHVAAVADASVCPILTADALKWREPATVLDDPLHIIEIDEPPED